jgi:hypothetical protein
MKSIRGVWVEMNGDHLAGDRRDRVQREQMRRELCEFEKWGGRLYMPQKEGELILMPGDHERLVG